jgi:ABC-type dipeptide/oligopeptide/nickel transport system permease component
LALLVGLPVGLLSALRQNSLFDHGGQMMMMLLFAIPTFVLVPVSQLVFGADLQWLPVTGWGDPGIQGLKEMILPVTLYAASLTGYFAKSFRSFMLEVMRQDYIRTARAKGLKERVVIYVHAFKNTLLPLASIVGPTMAYLIIGAFIIEYFFRILGVGYITVLEFGLSGHRSNHYPSLLIRLHHQSVHRYFQRCRRSQGSPLNHG